VNRSQYQQKLFWIDSETVVAAKAVSQWGLFISGAESLRYSSSYTYARFRCLPQLPWRQPLVHAGAGILSCLGFAGLFLATGVI